jgi:replicative DNA helicase
MDPSDRGPLHNIEAEQSLLGAILLNNAVFGRVAEFLKEEHFHDPAHRKIYAAIIDLIDDGKTADPVTLKAYLEKSGELREIGGGSYIVKLALSVTTTSDAASDAKIISDLYKSRQGTECELPLPRAEQAQTDLSEPRESTVQYRPEPFGWAERGSRMTKKFFWCRVHKTTGLSTGLQDLDLKLDGLHGGELAVLAGTPNVGKTALSTQIIVNIARLNGQFLLGANSGMFPHPKVLFFSFGGLASQLAIRMIAQATAVPLAELSHGGLNERLRGDRDIDKRLRGINYDYLEYLTLYFDQAPSPTLKMIQERAKSRGDDLALIIIDNLRLIDAGSGEREYPFDMREAALGLKRLAMELNVAILALAPIRRVNEGYEDHRPWSSDLYTVPLIEHADTVMFLHREGCDLSRREPIRRSDESNREFNDRHERWRNRVRDAGNVAELFIDRQRHGPTGLVRLNFDPATTRFTDYVETETA